MWQIRNDLGEAKKGAGVSNRPSLKCGTFSSRGLLRPQKTIITLLVGCAVFLRWFVALVLAQNGGETNCGQLWPRLLQGYLPLFVAVDKHISTSSELLYVFIVAGVLWKCRIQQVPYYRYGTYIQ